MAGGKAIFSGPQRIMDGAGSEFQPQFTDTRENDSDNGLFCDANAGCYGCGLLHELHGTCMTLSNHYVSAKMMFSASLRPLYLFRTVTSVTFATSAISFCVFFSPSKTHAT